jgi:phosphatidate cytidylyltransferase
MVWGSNLGGKYVYAVCASLMVGLAVYELGAMLKKVNLPNFPLLGGIFSGVILLLISLVYVFYCEDFCWMENSIGEILFPLLLFIIFCLFPITIFLLWLLLLFLFNKENKVIDAEKGLVEYAVQKKNYFLSICGSCGVTLMLAVPLFFTALVYLYEPFLFLFLVLVTKAMDTGGYIFGKLSSLLMGGNHKICPSFSPKKSWKGTIGGFIFSVGVSLLFYNYDPVDFGSDPVSGTCFSIYIYIILGIMLGLGSFAGDLTESAVKRICGVKDSNNIIPGMGGAFDVLDSFIYNGLLFWPLFVVKDVF